MKIGIHKQWPLVILGFLLVPLFYINVSNTHDWGDDFAGYLHQAKNITQGIPQNQTGYIVNDDYPTYAPASYPSGFPLLLSIVYLLFGGKIIFFKFYINCFLFAFLLLVFYFLRRKTETINAFLLTLIVAYNPWMLNFKAEIMSDIPFAFLMLAITYLILSARQQSLYVNVLTGLMTGLLISIRNIGIVIPITLMLHVLYNLMTGRKKEAITVRSSAIISVLAILIYVLLDKAIFPQTGHGLFAYSYIFDLNRLGHFLLTNTAYYFAVFRAFFEPWNGDWQFAAILCGTMGFSMTIIGIIKKWSTDFSFIDLLVIAYLAVIIVYPYTSAGFRFLLPIAPFLLHYLFLGIRSLNLELNVRPKILSLILTAFVFLSYQQGWRELANAPSVVTGPQQNANADAFQWIKEQTGNEAVFCFAKPRALSFYTNRPAMTVAPDADEAQIRNNLIKYNVDYVMTNKDESGEHIMNYVKGLRLVWHNDLNSIYEVRN